MYQTLTIANYVLEYAKKHQYGLSVLQLMKVLYFVQAQFLANTGKPLFDEPIIAEDYGPVEKSVWNKYSVYGNAWIPVTTQQNTSIAKEHTNDIDWTIDKVLGLDNAYLFQIIEHQTPYKNGRMNFPTFEITQDDLRKFFIN